MPTARHLPNVRAAKMRKWKGNFLKTTGSGFDENWDPSKDRFGSFAADQLKNFQQLAQNDPDKLQSYYNDKRAEVIRLHQEGKNLVDYGRNENGKLIHFLENRDGELNFAAQEFNKGGKRALEGAKNNQINQARERVLLGLATKADLVELYRHDHAKEKDDSWGAQIKAAFDDLFDNDFFDGFRFGFGQVLQLGAPIFDLLPQAEGVSEYLDEAGKFIQGDIDSVDTIIANQNRRGLKNETYENDVVKRVVPFDPHAGLIEDILAKKQKEAENLVEYQAQFRTQEYQDATLKAYMESQGLSQEQYDKIALTNAQYDQKYNQPTPEATTSADPEENEEAFPMLPEGQEFKQAPLEEVNDTLDTNIGNATPGGDLASVNSRLDKLQSSVDSLINRAKARKIKYQSKDRIMDGGALGDRKRKRTGSQGADKGKPLSPGDRQRLEELEDELAEIEFGQGDPSREPAILAAIRRINSRELEDLNRGFDDNLGGRIYKRRQVARGTWRKRSN